MQVERAERPLGIGKTSFGCRLEQSLDTDARVIRRRPCSVDDLREKIARPGGVGVNIRLQHRFCIGQPGRARRLGRFLQRLFVEAMKRQAGNNLLSIANDGRRHSFNLSALGNSHLDQHRRIGRVHTRYAADEHRAALRICLGCVLARRRVRELDRLQSVARAARTRMPHDRFLVLVDLPPFRQLRVPPARQFQQGVIGVDWFVQYFARQHQHGRVSVTPRKMAPHRAATRRARRHEPLRLGGRSHRKADKRPRCTKRSLWNLCDALVDAGRLIASGSLLRKRWARGKDGDKQREPKAHWAILLRFSRIIVSRCARRSGEKWGKT